MSTGMAQDMEAALVEDGIKKRGRSTWLSGVLRVFLSEEGAPELLAEEFYETQGGGSTTVSLTIDVVLDKGIEALLDRTKLQFGAVKDRSAVVRTALTQRLLVTV